MKRLQVYDQLRKMHAILKEIPEREDEWEQNAIDAVHSVLYLAEHVYTCEPVPTNVKRSVIKWTKPKFRKRKGEA